MKSIHSLIGALLLWTGQVFAGAPTHELTKETAIKLIKSFNEQYQEQVDVTLILDGKMKSEGVELDHVRQVVALHPVPENGKRVRRMRLYQFQWSDEYGWFTWEKREDRGTDAIYIWSEYKGLEIVR